MAPFRVRRAGRVLELSLATPDASVNVFGPPAAAQLDSVLADLPAGVEALVLRSAKTGSFVNGAGLLYANAMRSEEGALAVSAPVRAVYERLAAAPVLTVALLEGNCFGCGLELALACDVRLARDLAETALRMTEVTDYRFVPLFGGTWRLPRLVGKEAAAKLLLDGETWNAREARARGLVDAIVPNDVELDAEAVVARAERVGRRRTPRAPLAPRDVPPTRAALWRETLGLLRRSGRPDAICRQQEVAAFARTVTTPAAKNAMGFFFVRHTARAAMFGSAQRVAPALALVLDDDAPARWRVRLGRSSSAKAPRRARLAIVSPREARVGAVRLWFPRGPLGSFCEVSSHHDDLPKARAIAEVLEWRGIDVVLTFGAGALVSDALVDATARVLRAAVARGAEAERLNGAFWELGFAVPFRRIGRWPQRRAKPRAQERRTVAEVAQTWAAVVANALERRLLLHVSQGDVLVRALFDFPLELGSFSRWHALR